MLNKVIDIWEGFDYPINENGFRPKLTTYILDGEKERACVLVLPGGGYFFTSPREAEPIALQFNGAGFHAFVLDYSVSPAVHPQPLLDVSRAMYIIRNHADKWKIDPEKVAVCGFSAGGHLAASLGVHWDKEYLCEVPGIEIGMNRPNALILGYPVITQGEYGHRGSFENLLGKNPSRELLHEMSLEHHVSHITPPSFIWHTFADEGVPVENTLLFAQSLRENNIPFELHIYPEGSHGLSLGTGETATREDQINPHVATWMELCIQWLRLITKS